MRRRLALAGLAGLGLLPRAALAQPAPSPSPAWPTRSIRMVVAWPAGGGVDTPARLLSPHMARFLGQPVVLDNRGGATGSIGAGVVAQAAPDGYTMLADGLSLMTNDVLMRGLGYDFSSFAPVCQVSTAPMLLVVRAEHPARNLTELFAMARTQPGGMTYFSSGIAGGPHVTGLVLLRRAGIEATHVSYRGGSQSIAGLLGGDADFGFSTLPQSVPLVRDGRLRALAVSSAARMAALPDVPTVAEQGFPGFERAESMSFWVPAGTPPEAIARLNAATVSGLAEPEVRSRLGTLGMLPVGGTPAELARFAADYRASAGALFRAEGIRLE
jgi:tripartite-type tricarboxylate transporter receptor subunit TctC